MARRQLTRGQMTTITVGFTAVSLAFGAVIMAGTNRFGDGGDDNKKMMLQRGAGLDRQILARVNKERLQVLLNEAQHKPQSSEDRWNAALDGRSLGTHSVGSTAGVISGVVSAAQKEAAAAAGGK